MEKKTNASLVNIIFFKHKTSNMHGKEGCFLYYKLLDTNFARRKKI